MSRPNSFAGGREYAARPTDQPAKGNQPLRVVLVEDNDDDAQIILRLLRRGGYEPDWVQVQTAEALEEALAQGHWDIVLSDYTMPQCDALRALHKLREQSAHLPFIIVSGSIGEETAVAAMRAGASDYLMKTNLTRLVPAIERELRESAERQERSRTKRALMDLQAKFEVIFREYLDVMLVLDARDGGILHANEAVSRVLGYEESRLVGLSFDTLWPDDVQTAVAPLLQAVRRQGFGFYSGVFLRPDGTLLPMDLQASRAQWGRTDAIIVTLRDVSERLRAEQRLAQEKEQLAVTLRSIGEAVITTDIQGRVALLNGVAEQLTGWSQSEAAGRQVADVLKIFCGRAENSCTGRIKEVLVAGAPLELTRHVSLRSRDDRTYSVTLTATPIRGYNGRTTGVVTIVRDITSEQKLEEELQKASKLESVALMAGGIAHDFNNILTAIMGHLSLARSNAARAPQALATIQQACVYATDLTRQLLMFSKGSTPKRRVEAVAALVRENVEFALHGSNLRCDFRLSHDLWPAELDRGQINQVINNLVINAVQASTEAGVLEVSAVNVHASRERPVATLGPGKYVRVSIRDHGSGISPENLARIFDPYFTTKTAGSGLGLATVYAIIRKHDGLVQAESELGKGTVFHIYLPAFVARPPLTGIGAAGVGAASPDGADRAARSEKQGRILFMDDEVVLQELVGAMLEYLGYDVTCAADGEEAVRQFEAARREGRPYSAVILDLTVPGGMGGFEAQQRLQVLDPDVRTVVSSGYSNDPIIANYRGHGFSGAIAKPYQIAELSEVIQQVLA